MTDSESSDGSAPDAPWHEQPEFWESMGPVIFGKETRERAPVEVEGLEAITDLSPGADILDLACGRGRHALAFADRGYEVTAVDRTRAYLEFARDRAKDLGLTVEWIRDDMREFRRPNAFDLGLLLYTSFGLFEEPADNHSVLRNLFDSLRPGGAATVEVVSKEFIAAHFRERTWQELDDGSLFLARRRVEGPWKWLRNQWILVAPDGTRRSFQMKHRLYSAVELRERLAEAGFVELELFGGFDGRAFDRDSARMLAVGRRPPRS